MRHGKTLLWAAAVMTVGGAITLLAQAPASSAKAPKPTVPALTDAQKKAFVDWVPAHYQSPEDMIVGLFKDRDILFLANGHGKQEGEFAQGLMKRLHQAGIYNFVYEFTLHSNTAKMDALLTAPTFNEELAKDLIYNRYEDGYLEDIELYKSAWQVNHDRPQGTPPLRIVGINEPDGTDLAPKDTPLVELNRIRNAYLAGHRRDIVNYTWAGFLSRDFVANKQKALVYIGSAHATTHFRLDRRPLTAHFTSLGNYLFNYIGEKAGTVCLGAGSEKPAQIDELMAAVPAQFRRIGLVPTRGTPPGDLPIAVRGFADGRASDFTLADYCDGYVAGFRTGEEKKLTPFTRKKS
jgi:hypothetical protein